MQISIHDFMSNQHLFSSGMFTISLDEESTKSDIKNIIKVMNLRRGGFCKTFRTSLCEDKFEIAENYINYLENKIMIFSEILNFIQSRDIDTSCINDVQQGIKLIIKSLEEARTLIAYKLPELVLENKTAAAENYIRQSQKIVETIKSLEWDLQTISGIQEDKIFKNKPNEVCDNIQSGDSNKSNIVGADNLNKLHDDDFIPNGWDEINDLLR